MTTKDFVELVDFSAELGNAFEKSLEDGKLMIDDAQNFFPAIFIAPQAINGIGNIVQEWQEVKQNEAARMELTNRFREKFDLGDDVTEYDVEEIFESLVRAAAAVGRIANRIRAKKEVKA